jgi:hypothetical protein
LIVRTALRTRGVVLLVAAALAGFASVHLPESTKAASLENAAANGIYQACQSQKAAAFAFGDAHPPCQWAEGGDAGGGFCWRIYCWD